jgi:hypothetical protein
VENTANIYFDFNVAVITEPAVFTVQLPAAIEGPREDTFVAYPDPFADHVTLKFPMPLTAQHLLELIDVHGRVVRTFGGTSTHAVTMQRDGLPSGAYIMRLSNAGKTIATVRIVAQ